MGGREASLPGFSAGAAEAVWGAAPLSTGAGAAAFSSRGATAGVSAAAGAEGAAVSFLEEAFFLGLPTLATGVSAGAAAAPSAGAEDAAGVSVFGFFGGLPRLLGAAAGGRASAAGS